MLRFFYEETHISCSRLTMSLVAGFEARRMRDKRHSEKFYMQQNDACMLRLFEAFLRSAPQLTLQLYICLVTDSRNPLTGV